MADQQQQQSSRKRQHKRDDDDSEESSANKRRRSNDDEPSLDTNEEKKTATITTIYYDCLERIFEFLDLESLVNVAGTCKRLQIAATAKFSDDYGKERVSIYASVSNQDLFAHNNIIREHDLKFLLPFLRCFGSKFSVLCISINRHTNEPLCLQRRRYLHEYISEYCADTLTSISLYGESDYSMKHFSKPFKNVEKLGISSDRSNNELSNIVNIFPNLRQLQIYFEDWRGTSHYLIPEIHLPHLKHLLIMGHPTNRITNFVAANHQLQIVEFQSLSSLSLSLNEVLDVIIGNASISKLVVGNWTREVNVTAHELLRLAREHPVLAELDLGGQMSLSADDAIALIRQPNALKKFRFRVKDRSQYDRLLQLDGDWQHEFREYAQNWFAIALKR